MDRLPHKWLVNGLAIIVILGVCAVIGISLWINAQARGAYGPTLLVTDAAGGIITNIGPTLYRLDRGGGIEQRLPTGALGLPALPLTDGLVLPDGRLLLGVPGGEYLYDCDLGARRCRPFLQDGPRPAAAFKMTWDERRQRLLLIDGKGHRILAYDPQGRFLAESRGGEDGLRFPNTPFLTPRDELIIADTNQHRLVALDPDTLDTEAWDLPVETGLGSFRRIWPTDVLQTAGGTWWVIIDNDLLANGDVMLFDDQRQPLRRLDLPADWDPIKLRLHGDDVLLAGHGSVELLIATTDGRLLSPFGGTAFRQALAGVRSQRLARDRWTDLWLWVCIVPLVLAGGFAAYLDYRQRRASRLAAPAREAEAAAPLPPAATDGIHWLQHNPVVARQWRQLRWGIYLIAALLLLPVVMVIYMAGLEKTAGIIAVILAAAVPLIIWIVLAFRILAGGRLGIAGDRLVLSRAGGKPRFAHPRQLVYGKRFISNGETTVFTRTAKDPIFRDEDLKHHVLPRLQSARQLTAWQGYRFLLQAGDHYTWLTTLGLAYMAALYLCMEYFLPAGG